MHPYKPQSRGLSWLLIAYVIYANVRIQFVLSKVWIPDMSGTRCHCPVTCELLDPASVPLVEKKRQNESSAGQDVSFFPSNAIETGAMT